MTRIFARVVCGAAALVSLYGCRDEGPVVPAATIKHVMASVTDPASKRIFEAAAEPPTEVAAWQVVAAEAQATAETGTRLINAVRGGNKREWVVLAGAMSAAARKVGDAAAARDPTALAASADKLYETCEGCHKRFQPKPDKPA